MSKYLLIDDSSNGPTQVNEYGSLKTVLDRLDENTDTGEIRLFEIKRELTVTRKSGFTATTKES